MGNHLCTLNNRMTMFIKYHIQHTLKSTDVDYWANLQKEKLTGALLLVQTCTELEG